MARVFCRACQRPCRPLAPAPGRSICGRCALPTATRLFDLAIALPNAAQCQACIQRFARALAEQPGVQAVELTPEGDKLIVYYDPERTSGDALARAAAQAGQAITQRYRHERLNITEMDCIECARTVEAALTRLPGVLTARVDFALGQLDLAYDSSVIERQRIIGRIRDLGYDVVERGPVALRFTIEGLDCAECLAGVETLVENVAGVIDAQISLATATMTVTVEGTDDLPGRIARAVAEAGYTARLQAGEIAAAPPRQDLVRFLLRQARGQRTLASAGLFAVGGILSLLNRLPLVSIGFFAAAIVVGGYDVARSGVASLRATRNVDINVLLTIAVLGAAATGQWAEAAGVVVLFSVGNTLEAATLDRTRDALRALIALSPPVATLIHNGHDERVRVEALRPGDRVRVRPGERIPADGEVVEGISAVDESPITGEAIPADKAPGDRVYAGTVNGNGALVVHVTQPPGDSTLARIVRLVEQAQAQKAPSERFVDRFARVYTPAVIAMAILLAVIPPLFFGASPNAWILRALTLLVIACPCALVISTPVAIISALGHAARKGALIKGGNYLEAAGSLKAMAFDKTRTLTEGRPVVTEVLSFGPLDRDRVLALATAVERNSEHPLAQAVVREGRHRGVEAAAARDFEALPGRGARGRVDRMAVLVGNRSLIEEYLPIPEAVEAQLVPLEQEGQTVFIVARCAEEPGRPPCELLGAIAVADRLRPESRAAVEELRRAGLRPIVMLTGDDLTTALAVARQAGVDRVLANLLPHEKVEAIEDLLAAHGAVGMVGDGINDAPALARATVGIAMGAAGSDAALETADIALMGDDLSRVPATIRLSRRALAIIRQNVAFSLLIKIAFVVLAALGAVTLWMAVFADTGTSLLVTLNGMRLR